MAAMNDVFYVSPALALTAWVLWRSANRNGTLIAALRARAALDPLTGLASRQALVEAIEAQDVDDTPGRGTALVVFDVDHFKAVNDTFGHPVGDEVLRQVASLVRSQCREHDMAARMGGDELAVLVRSCSPAQAVELARRVVKSIGEHVVQAPGRAGHRLHQRRGSPPPGARVLSGAPVRLGRLRSVPGQAERSGPGRPGTHGA